MNPNYAPKIPPKNTKGVFEIDITNFKEISADEKTPSDAELSNRLRELYIKSLQEKRNLLITLKDAVNKTESSIFELEQILKTYR